MTDLCRHALVWLTETPQPILNQDTLEIRRWHENGNPFVACRQREQQDLLKLGFCLPAADSPETKPRRLSVQSPAEYILRVGYPPLLAEAAKSALEPTLGDRLSRLSLAGSAEGLSLRVFGSWMWQTLTGRSYVNRCSDLDLLAEVRTEAEADVTTAFLQREASIGTFNLDGELSVPGLGEVHWKEYLSKAPMLLLKSFSNVRLIQREELWK